MKTMKDFVENAEARGSVANPCCSADEAIGILRDEIWGGVFVTKEVFDRFDWRDHVGLSKSSSCRVVHGMNESENVANAKIVDRTTMSQWEGGDGPDAGWRVYAWRLEWTYASEKQLAWILHMAEEGWKNFKGKER
jgi:hypothetical protein